MPSRLAFLPALSAALLLAPLVLPGRTGIVVGTVDTGAPHASRTPVVDDTIEVAPPTGEQETDRAKVQTAFDAVKPGGTIQFARGTYLLGAGARLTVPDVTVLGHPDGTVLRGCEPSVFEVERADIGRVVFGCTGLYVQTEGQTIRDLTFEYTWHGIVVGPYPTTGKEAAAFWESGEGPPDSYPAGGQRIEGNTFRATPNGLRVLGTGEERSIVRDNDFIDVFHAIGIYGAPLHFLDNRVTVEDPSRVPSSRHPGSAILVSPGYTDCAGHVIAGNRVEGYPGAIYVLADRGQVCRGVEIRDNTIEVRGVKVPEAWGGATPTEDDSTIVGVPITLTSLDRPLPWQPDVETEGVVEEIVIEGNRLLGAEGLGILVDGSRNRISRNIVTDIRRRDPFPGITWIGDEHVTWETANGSGIWVSPGSEHNEIAGNRFEDIAGAAIYLEGDNNEVRVRSATDSVHDLGRGNRVVGVQDAEVPRTGTFPGLEETPYPYAEPEEVGLSAERLEALGDRVAGWVRDSSIVGAELLLVKDRRIVLHEAIGWSDREAGEAMRRNTIYRIRSMTKPFTATAALMLVEEGELALDAPVSRWLPSWDNERSGEITVRQLLTHTAGWVQSGSPKVWGTYPNLRAVVDDVGEHGPQHAPGKAFRYSDVHSNTLGVLVEEVSGLPIEQFIEARIVEPFGLHDTHIHISFTTDTAWADRMNPTYQRVDGEWEKYWSPDDNPRTPFFPAAYGLVSTVFDYARWLEAWMRWGRLNNETDPPTSVRTPLTGSETTGPATKPLLSKAMVREALTPSSLGPYGLHWDVRSVDPLVFGHGGSDGTDAMAVPSRDLMILFFTQSRNNQTLEAWRRAALEAAAPDLPLDRPVASLAAAEADLHEVALSAAERNRYVGNYRPAPASRTAEVWEKDGKLHFKPAAPRAESIPLVPLGDHTFALGRYDRDELTTVVRPLLRLRFQIEDGHVSSLRLLRDGEAIGELIRIE